MPNKENLIPVKKGEIRNPWGKGKGTLNRATVVKMVLSMEAELPEKVLQELRKLYPTEFNKKKYNSEFIATVILVRKMILTGDPKIYKVLMDSAYGMPKGSGVNIEQIQINAEIKKKADEALRGMEL